MTSSAHCVTLLLCLMSFSFIHARKETPCPGKHSIWDKWFDGCNWCVCTEDGPKCTDKSCYRMPVDVCETPGEKWRDGCYRCQCRESGIVCIADHRCVHAMKDQPFLCEPRLGCVCGLDGLPSCIADSKNIDVKSQQPQKRPHDNKYVSNMPHLSKDRYIALTQKMTCRDEKRWYSGTERCFCAAGAREPTCGNPRYISHKVDGFRFKIAQCYSNQEWDYNCRKCRCHMYGFGFCVRIPNCKRNTSFTDRHITFEKKCENGHRWQEGCKYCECTNNRISCDSSGCNLSGNIAETKVTVKEPPIILGEADIQLTGGGKQAKNYAPGKVNKIIPRFQIPPPHFLNMFRSFRDRKGPESISQVLCEGKHKPGDTFYDKCNLCTCTKTGDSKCTAILCV